MKELESPRTDFIRLAIQQEACRSDELRYQHRLHALLLISSGQSCQKVAALFGEDRRTVQRWIRRFETDGLDGLRDGEHVGRPTSLNERQWEKLRRDLGRRPKSLGIELRRWDGRLLSEHILERFKVTLGLRQCQRILRELRVGRPGSSL